MRNVRCCAAVLCSTLLSSPVSFSQTMEVQPPPDWRGTKPESWHSRLTGRYTPDDIPPINLTNSTRIDQLVRAGRIYLSLQDAIALALENNLDIELQRYGPRIAQADLLRAQAGGLLRGVPQAIQGSPQSAVNLQTGNTAGSGTAQTTPTTTSTGTSGTIITSTGTTLPNFDEVMFTSYNWGHRSIPQANSFTTGVPTLVFENSQFQWGFQKGFSTGTTVTAGYSSTGQNSNNLVAQINPVNSGYANLQITQRLLQGFGIAVNTRNIRIAKNDVRISDLVFRLQVQQTVAAVVNLYADLVSFNENVRVKQQALKLAEKLNSDNKKQVRIGTLAPIEIVRAEAEVARSQQELTGAETLVLQQETILKNALSRTGVFSAAIADARIVPTDSLRMPDNEPIQPIQDLLARALQNRPEIAQTDINIESAKINLGGTKSQLLPSLDLIGNLQNNGLAGDPNPLRPGGGNLVPPNPALLGNYGDMFAQIARRNYPDYAIGFQLSIPLRNRAAQADVIRDQLALRQSQILQRKQINQVRVEVQNALIGLQQARAQYQAALKARILQEQTLDAENKKFALGASTIFFVIQAQRDLAQSQASEVLALSLYNRAKVQLDLSIGTTLQTFDINIDEARKGQVSKPASTVPGVEAPNGSL